MSGNTAREVLDAVANTVSEFHPTVSRAEIIAKTLERYPDFYAEDMAFEVQPELVAKLEPDWPLQQVANDISKAHPDLSDAQCVARALDEHPSLYR